MADFDHDAFAEAFEARLSAIGYTADRAVQKWPDTDKAMISRARNGKPLSSGNMLLLCQMAGLDPFAFLIVKHKRRVTRKTILKQMVTVPVTRETESSTSRGAPEASPPAAPAARGMSRDARSGLRPSAERNQP